MESHWKYLKYVLRHKWYVFLECFRFGLYWRGIVHDLSKFRPCEWGPYVEYFYTDKQSREGMEGQRQFGLAELAPWGFYVEDRFDVAWLKHIHRNPHHWQYWILRKDDGNTIPLPMPFEYVLEMVCDWRGAGRAIHGKDETVKWYTKNRDKMVLHPQTRKEVETLLCLSA